MFDKLIVIDSVKTEDMIVTWDMGRFCNYDCTYCPPHRHDNFSPHAKLDELKATARFALNYIFETIRFKRLEIKSHYRFNLTGGEPTIHPEFIEFGKWLKETFNNEEKYRNTGNLNLTITSNGAFSRKICDHLIQNYNFVTISYHCEAPKRLKQKVRDNIMYLKEKSLPMSINVMFHAKHEYFQECVELCESLRKAEIDFIPRMIGEHSDNNKYHHHYTPDQLNWMKEYWFKNKREASSNTTDKKESEGEANKKDLKMARDLGRPCCGGREMNVCDKKTKQWEKTKFLKFAKFKDWKCSVNWFFLHIEQQTGLIYHHQTCQARFDGTRGPIGTIKNRDQILNQLRENLKNKKMPVITCPNKICGCGLCVPKATQWEGLKQILGRHIDMSVFENSF